MVVLDPRAAMAGVRLIAYRELGSTNSEALDLARQGERGPLWVVAERQTGGRGRRGRVWVSQPGNLFASLLLTSPAPTAKLPQLSLVAALAVHDAVTELATALCSPIKIKWPNDLLLGGAKLGGILVEGESAHEGAVAIGIGVNCVSHPTGTALAATDLRAAGFSITPGRLVGALSARMFVRLEQWNRGEGFSLIRADWIARAAAIGETVSVRLADRELSGRFETLDEAGGLVLRTASGRREVITAADAIMTSAAAAHAG
jgi:BirA family biotin operon repressor/biotin-[acetyl-CoA-carboxylase] ligase